MAAIYHGGAKYGGGSLIEPNPQGTPSNDLESIGIDGISYSVVDADAIHTSDVGVVNGVAELDANGKVPASQLPSYVDDVIEAYYDSISDRFYEESTFTTVIPPESGKTWVDIPANKSYRWTGSVYVRVDEGVQLGETSDTAYRGDRGKIAYDHSQSDHSGIKPAFTEASTRANIASGETIATIFGKIKKFFSDLKTVAFTGAYSDLSGTPTIPTVNNGTLTIQRNGTQVQTFSANQSANATANIECATPSDVEGAKTATGNPLTITDAAPIKAEQLVFEIEPIQAGSGTPSPSNIRAITGLSEVSGGTCGKNLINPAKITESANHVNGYVYSDGDGLLVDAGPYTLSVSQQCNGLYVSEAVEGASSIAYVNNSDVLTFTIPNKMYIKMQSWRNSGVTGMTYQLEKGNQATTYEAYKPKNVTVQLGQTVYGGTLTLNADGSAECYVDTGVITDMSTSTDIEWENAAGLIAQGVFPFTITGADYVNQVWLSEAYNIKYQSNWNMNNGEIIVVKTSGGSVGARLQNTSYNTLAGLKASLAGQKLVYALATPFTIHLSAEQLQLLENLNNISTNAKTLTVKYQPNNAIGEAKGLAMDVMDYTEEVARDNYSRNTLPLSVEHIKAKNTGTWSDNSIVINNITFTIVTNDNGDVIGINRDGTSNASTLFTIFRGKYPSKGKFLSSGMKDGQVFLGHNDTFDTAVNYTNTNFTVTSENDELLVRIGFASGQTFNNDLIQPMVTDSNVENIAFQEYIPTNKELWEMIKALQN